MSNEAFLESAVAEARVARSRGAPIIPEAAAAHAAVESAYGRSGLAVNARNLFGTKATGQHTPFWFGDYVEMPTWEVIDGERVDTVARFRAYASWAASFGDYGDIIRRVYPNAADANCGTAFLAGLFLTGPLRWATDPLAYDKSARVMGMYAGVLCPEPIPSVPEDTLLHASTLVMHDLTWNDRLSILVAGGRKVVLERPFAYRVRGGKLDVRRE